MRLRTLDRNSSEPAINDAATCNKCKNVFKTKRILAQSFHSVLFQVQGHSFPKTVIEGQLFFDIVFVCVAGLPGLGEN
jgi:hypothetical protein